MKLLLALIVSAFALALTASSAHAAVTLGPAVAPLGAGRVSMAWKATETEPMSITLHSPGHPERTAMSTVASGIHRVQVDGLEPGVEYTYRLGRLPGRFMSPPDASQDVRFGVFGDTRNGDGVHRAIVSQLAAVRPDFYLMTGDVLIDGDASEAWEHFFNLEQPLLSQTPFTSVRGNHDGESSVFGRLITPQSSTGEAERSYGSMTLGPVHVVLLDTEQSVAPGSPQYAWAERDLAENRARPTFVLLHRPLFSTSVHGGDARIQRALAPLFQRYGVDVVFQGHDHAYVRSAPINGVTYVVTGGGGAPLYGAANASWVDVRESVNHYLIVDASASRIHVVAKRLDGSVLDTFDIDPRANDNGRYAATTSLPTPGGGGCAMVLFRPGAFRRTRETGAALSTFGPVMGLVVARGARRRIRIRRGCAGR